MNLTKNWKTTVAGIALIAVLVLTKFGVISPDQSSAITSLLAAFGLAAAKDSNVTGV